MFSSPIVPRTKIIKKRRPRSLSLLKTKALNAAFKELTLVDQKLIKKNEVKPISSHPKNSTIKFPLITKMHILIINSVIKVNKRSTCGSYLKYENEYISTQKPIDSIRLIYVIESLSSKISKETATEPGKLNHLKPLIKIKFEFL